MRVIVYSGSLMWFIVWLDAKMLHGLLIMKFHILNKDSMGDTG